MGLLFVFVVQERLYFVILYLPANIFVIDVKYVQSSKTLFPKWRLQASIETVSNQGNIVFGLVVVLAYRVQHMLNIELKKCPKNRTV